MPRIYADNAATTKISQTAMKAMISAMENSYGNPSSIHQIGMAANDALQTAREQIARCLGCMPKEIFFTSGGRRLPSVRWQWQSLQQNSLKNPVPERHT